jgi:hypothetical protein
MTAAFLAIAWGAKGQEFESLRSDQPEGLEALLFQGFRRYNDFALCRSFLPC